MKPLLTLIFCISIISSSGQKIALLNTNFKSPIIYTDSLTIEQLKSNLFPVSINDFDTLYANLDFIDKMLKIRQRSKMKSFELHSGATIITISRVPFSNGDRYVIKAETTIGGLSSNFHLTDIHRTNKKNSEKIEQIMAYMKSNKDLFKLPYPVHPKLYNVIVITE